MRLVQFLEGKQVGLLYHYTNLWNAQDILNKGVLRSSAGEYSTDYKANTISFSRNKNYHNAPNLKPMVPMVRLTFDGDKISNRYKTHPVAGGLMRVPHARKGPHVDEAEQIVYAAEMPVYPYLLKVDLNLSLINFYILRNLRDQHFGAIWINDMHERYMEIIRPEQRGWDIDAWRQHLKEVTPEEFGRAFMSSAENQGIPIGLIEGTRTHAGVLGPAEKVGESYSQQELDSMDIDTLDQMAFGIKQGLHRMPPEKIVIVFHDDYENALHDMKNSGKTKEQWAKEYLADGNPIDVKFRNGRFELWDGHHRWLAANILDTDLPVNLEIADNPTRKLLGLTEERLQNPRTGKRFNVYKNPTTMELKGIIDDANSHGYEFGELGAWLVGKDWIVWNRYHALHADIERQMGIQNGIPLDTWIDVNNMRISVQVTDSSKRTSWHHNPAVAQEIMDHPRLRPFELTGEIEYYDSAIVGSWHDEGFNESNPIFMDEGKKGRFYPNTVYHLYMPKGGEEGVLIGWRADWPKSSWVEFRGPNYTQWTGDQGSDFEKVHDSMKGWHTTVLHTDDIIDILPTHPDYEKVRDAIEGAADNVSESQLTELKKVYHSTPHEVDEFRPLTHFGGPKSAEDLFLQHTDYARSQNLALEPYRTYQSKIDMKNPVIMWDTGKPHDVMEILKGLITHLEMAAAGNMYGTKADDEEYTKYTPPNYTVEHLYDLGEEWDDRESYLEFSTEAKEKEEEQRKKDLVWLLKSKGHDGIKYINQQEGKGTWSYISLDPVKAESKVNTISFLKKINEEDVSYNWHGKNVVWEYDDFRIAVDKLGDASYVTLWSPDNKRIGYLSTTSKAAGGLPEGDWLFVSMVHIDKGVGARDLGLGTQMYKVLLNNMDPRHAGLIGYKPDIGHEKIPSIYYHLGATEMDDYYIVQNPNKAVNEMMITELTAKRRATRKRVKTLMLIRWAQHELEDHQDHLDTGGWNWDRKKLTDTQAAALKDEAERQGYEVLLGKLTIMIDNPNPTKEVDPFSESVDSIFEEVINE